MGQPFCDIPDLAGKGPCALFPDRIVMKKAVVLLQRGAAARGVDDDGLEIEFLEGLDVPPG